jgi:hypothetical protein
MSGTRGLGEFLAALCLAVLAPAGTAHGQLLNARHSTTD